MLTDHWYSSGIQPDSRTGSDYSIIQSQWGRIQIKEIPDNLTDYWRRLVNIVLVPPGGPAGSITVRMRFIDPHHQGGCTLHSIVHLDVRSRSQREKHPRRQTIVVAEIETASLRHYPTRTRPARVSGSEVDSERESRTQSARWTGLASRFGRPRRQARLECSARVGCPPATAAD